MKLKPYGKAHYYVELNYAILVLMDVNVTSGPPLPLL